ncbi:MAG: hypothetical protein AAFV53_42535, partial [Myxococcota bacterium]
QFQDGVCSYDFREGILIPVFSGKPPVSERMIGMVFVGKGDLAVRFPDRSDAWLFANHMTNNTNIDPDRLKPILRGDPFTTFIDRGLILSADPNTLKMLYNLEPVGSGVMISEGEDGVDEIFVVTENRGGLRAKVVGINLLANRTRQMQRSGLDPQVIIRQDRMLHEELRFPGDQLRMVADFRTDVGYRVAELEGQVVGSNNYDRWMTCYRDGQDLSDTGYRTMAFSHGTDSDQRRHFMRFSGERFHKLDFQKELQPPVRMVPVSATSQIEIRPFRRGLEQRGDVSSTLTLRAQGADLQHIAMRLPTGTALPRTWTMDSLRLKGGPELAWVGMAAGLAGDNLQLLRVNNTQDGIAANGDAEETTSQPGSANDAITAAQPGGGNNNGLSQGDGEDAANEGTGLVGSSENAALTEREAVIRRRTRFEILVMLPETVPEGEEVTIEMKWHGNWPFASFTVSEGLGPDGTNVVRNLGNSTGPQPFLPDILPSPGGTAWNHETTLGFPTPLFRSMTGAISGDTEEAWLSEGDGWNWVRVKGENQRNPSLILGRWYNYEEGPAQDLPGVKVNLFPKYDGYQVQFPPELRRIVSFYERFLPDFPANEIEVYQGPSQTLARALTGASEAAGPGLVGIEMVATTSVTGGSAVRRENPYLTQHMIARQVAAQYWGQQLKPASSREAWLFQALSDAYGYFYIRGAFGFDAYAKVMTEVREDLERPYEISVSRGADSDFRNKSALSRALALTTPPGLTDIPARIRNAYGVYVIAEMLRNRIGDAVFFEAIDKLAQERAGQRLTTEIFQTIIEESTGRDWSNFFDYWVHGGFLPSIVVSVPKDPPEGTFRGCIETDIPYGAIDVPIRIVDQDGERMVEALVDVVEGRGYFEVSQRDGKVEVEVDPYGMVLAAKRTVKTVNTLPCEDVFAADAETADGELDRADTADTEETEAGTAE